MLDANTEIGRLEVALSAPRKIPNHRAARKLCCDAENHLLSASRKLDDWDNNAAAALVYLDWAEQRIHQLRALLEERSQ